MYVRYTIQDYAIVNNATYMYRLKHCSEYYMENKKWGRAKDWLRWSYIPSWDHSLNAIFYTYVCNMSLGNV